MSKICLILAVAVAIVVLVGCKSTPSGSREYVPGQGWVPTK